MMADGEDHWREGGAGALGHLLERMSNDFTPQHDSQHFQPGFVPSATPPWTNAAHTSLGSPMTSLQSGHAGLGPQISTLQTTHTDLGPQVPSMQTSHSSIRPHIASLQSASGTVSGPAGLPPAPPHSGPSARSYSVSQDLFSEYDGGRSPLLRSSSDLGARMSNFHNQGCHFTNDGQLDSFITSSLDAHDGLLVGGQDSAFSFEVGRGASATPPLQADSQGITTAPQHDFSFYSNESDCILESKSASTISAKFSNFTASLGSLFSPFEPPFRSNLTDTQNEAHSSQQVTGTGTKPSLRNPSVTQATSGATSGFTPTKLKGSKPSYSDVLSKTPVQDYKPSPASTNVHSKCSPSMMGVSGVNTGLPTNSATGQESKVRSPLTSNLKPSKVRTLSTSSIVNNNSLVNHSDKCREKENSHACSRVGLDEFDLSEVGLKNGIPEHFDWGIYNSCENDSSFKTNSLNHAAKKVAGRDHKKASPEKVTTDPTTLKPSSQLNNKLSSNQRKQLPKQTSYINNILNGASTSSTQPGSNIPASSPQPSSSQSSPASSAPRPSTTTESSDSYDKSKSLPTTKDERKPQESGSSKASGRSKVSVNGRPRENPPKRMTVRRRKDTSFTQSEMVVHGWSVAVHWLAVAMQALLWLATLAADVVVMSSRLLGQLLVVAWARLLHYWVLVKAQGHHCWARVLALFKKKDKEEKKTSGREKKVVKGLECNISLPTTGDEAMKRLLACKGKDPYSILGVTQDCTDEDIKKYYKRQAFLVHPDKNKQPGAEEAFKILAHAFEIIGEPERRCEYDTRLAEEVQLEGAWGELASLLTRLQEKLDEAANTIRCTNCNKRHRRVKLPRPIYAARHCAECQIHHAAREGDIWAESTMLGLRWRYYACMEGAVYDISDWAACQSDNLKHLQANTHSVQYRIVSGKKNPPSKNSTPEFPSDPDLEEFFNNLCKEKFGKSYASGGSQGAQSDMRKRKSKKKK